MYSRSEHPTDALPDGRNGRAGFCAINKREHEKAIFQAFLGIEPNFCGESLSNWRQPTDEKEFPDIIATSISGRRIGVELGEWLNEDEIQAAKRKEQLEESFLAAIGEQAS